MRWFDYLLAMALGAVGALALLQCTAKAEELSAISERSAAYCALYAREMVFIETMDGKGTTADTDYILADAKKHYGECISVLPTLLPLPQDLRAWLADMRDMMLLVGRERTANVGTVPAKETPVNDEEEWRAQCRAEYNTWEEETGTVIRRGNPERVRCPCGGEVTCGE